MLLYSIKYLYPNISIKKSINIKKVGVNDILMYKDVSDVAYGAVKSIDMKSKNVTLQTIKFKTFNKFHGCLCLNDSSRHSCTTISFDDVIQKCEVTCGFINRFTVLQYNKVRW